MSSEVQDFANRLSTALAERFRASRHPYVSVDVIQQAIQRALDPEHVTDDYPRMLFLRAQEQRMVSDRNEEEAALAEGFTRTAPMQFEPGFPCWRVEKSTGQGGWKYPSADIRRVMLRSSEELRQFEAVTERDDWLEDDVSNAYGARGVALADLVAERKDLLKRLVDQELLEVEYPTVGDEIMELPCEVAVPEPVTGQNPDDFEEEPQ